MKRIATLVTGIALIAPGSALAQSSSQCQGYNGQTCAASAVSAATSPTSTAATTASTTTTTGTTSSSTLPFTGLDVGLLIAGGGTLLGAGLAVRRVSRRLE